MYDVTKYLDDHPGGAEVILDVAGQDADEFFEGRFVVLRCFELVVLYRREIHFLVCILIFLLLLIAVLLDIGHSKEARTELKKYLIGSLKMDEAALAAQKAAEERKASQAAGGSSGMLVVIAIAVVAVAFGVYKSSAN